MKRSTADNYVRLVQERAASINTGPYAFVVERIEVFGSYLTDKAAPGDLDLMVTLRPRYADAAHQEALRADRQLAADQNGQSFNPYWLRAYWPTEEIHRLIRGRNYGISIHTADERQQLADLGATFQTIYEGEIER